MSVHWRRHDQIRDPNRERPERNAHQQTRRSQPADVIAEIERHLHDQTQREHSNPHCGDDGIGAIERLVTSPIGKPGTKMLGR